MQVTRQYHSTALLLPDGRVLSSGGGICGTCDQVGYLAKNAEIFSPPYLFQADGTLAPRPVDRLRAAAASYGAAMQIATREPGLDPQGRARAARRRHALEQHGAALRPADLHRRRDELTATAPANANIAPPGFYMLFIVDAQRRAVGCAHGHPPGQLAADRDAHAAADGATFTAPAAVNLAATASDTDGTVTKVEFFNGATKLGEDTTAPYSFAWSGVGSGTYSLTARATDDLGGVTTSLASTITVSSSNSAPTVTLTQPSNGATFTAPAAVNLAATASDTDGTVTKVEFFNGTDEARRGHDRAVQLCLERRRQRNLLAHRTRH